MEGVGRANRESDEQVQEEVRDLVLDISRTIILSNYRLGLLEAISSRVEKVERFLRG